MATMLVETFEELEHDHETGAPECDAEAIAIMEKMGLEGQLSMLTRGAAPEERRRHPYREMRKDEIIVYRQLLPKTTDLKSYKMGPIPVRVLQVAAHAQEFFDVLHVWHPEAEVKDPLLVGGIGKYSWRPDQQFILARWGEVLLPWDELVKRAAQSFRDKAKAEAIRIRAKVDQFLSSIDALPDAEVFGDGGELPMARHLD